MYCFVYMLVYNYIVVSSFHIIIYHKFLCTFFLIVQYYFHVTVSHFISFVTMIYISRVNTYYVHMLSVSVVVQFKYHAKLSKIRCYIKCPLMLLLFSWRYKLRQLHALCRYLPKLVIIN